MGTPSIRTRSSRVVDRTTLYDVAPLCAVHENRVLLPAVEKPLIPEISSVTPKPSSPAALIVDAVVDLRRATVHRRTRVVAVGRVVGVARGTDPSQLSDRRCGHVAVAVGIDVAGTRVGRSDSLSPPSSTAQSEPGLFGGLPNDLTEPPVTLATLPVCRAPPFRGSNHRTSKVPLAPVRSRLDGAARRQIDEVGLARRRQAVSGRLRTTGYPPVA